MKNKNWIAMLLCGAMLLGGCGNSGADTSETDADEASAQEAGIEETGVEKVSMQEAGMDEAGVEEVSVQEAGVDEAGVQEVSSGENAAQNAGEEGSSADETGMGTSSAASGSGSLVIEAGPDKPVYDSGSLIYTLHDFKLYESAEDVSISKEKMVLEDARSYADRSKFLLMQVDIRNIDYQGDDNDGNGEMNLSLFMIMPKDLDESDQWGGSLPVYLSEPGQGATDYYHVFVKPGETKTVTVGFYVPVNNGDELRSQCRISLYGNMDEGYVYEIPEVQ